MTYNRDFVLEPVGEMLDNIRAWVSECGPVASGMTEITREMARQLANMLTREGSPQHRRISEQIDKASLASGRDVSRRRRRKGDA